MNKKLKKQFEIVIVLKVQGSEEYNFSFIKSFWKDIKIEVINAVGSFSNDGR